MIDEDAIFMQLISTGEFIEQRPCAICKIMYSPGQEGSAIVCMFCEEDEVEE